MASKDKSTESSAAMGANISSAPTGPEMVRKLSAKTIMGRVYPPKKKTPLYVVIGVTHGVKTGTGDNGPWVAFLGSFEATRVALWDRENEEYSDGDHQVFQSGQCFVPKALEDILLTTVQAQQEGDTKRSVEFAIEVGVEPSDTAIRYAYYVKNLIKVSGADPLAALRSAPQVAGFLTRG